ncbi:hypothetical protein JG687_00014485 [Phytophthora cactorum]|uniref:START-like domain n=1 Tax=Phytophthora cactorum TaxID=29920 RepID=A0A8T1TWV9_9STRA|nr:hypothetical protein JG687_00014485 [Phytophthora cactorum]
MFGLETPDFAAIQLRSETLFKHRLDGAVLAQLAGPTETDPFQFMGITRMVGQRNWPLNLVAHPRDFIVVSATGVMMHTNGELIGYEVVQSIDLPQCPPLPKPTVRGELMYGVIYRQREDGDVDVFVQMHMETRCHLYDKLVIAEIWESALGFWNAPSLAEAKKLQWCLHQKSVLPWQSQHQEPAEIALDNQKQREAHQNNGSKREKKTRSAFLSGMVNSLSDVGINQVQRASQTMRRKTKQPIIPVG